MRINEWAPQQFTFQDLNRTLTINLCLRSSGIMGVGLWPFHSPKNEVSWLNHRNGIRFGKHGSVVSAGTFRAEGSYSGNSCSLGERCLSRAESKQRGRFLHFIGVQTA